MRYAPLLPKPNSSSKAKPRVQRKVMPSTTTTGPMSSDAHPLHEEPGIEATSGVRTWPVWSWSANASDSALMHDADGGFLATARAMASADREHRQIQIKRFGQQLGLKLRTQLPRESALNVAPDSAKAAESEPELADELLVAPLVTTSAGGPLMRACASCEAEDDELQRSLADGLVARACASCEVEDELRRACASCSVEDDELRRACASCEPEQQLQLQAKLQVGDADSPAEREADHIADRVLDMSVAPAPSQLSWASRVDSWSLASELHAGDSGTVELRRDCSSCEAEDELRREAAASRSGGPTSAGFANRLEQVRRNGGRHLDATARVFLERRLGHELHDVRIHDNHEAASLAAQISARAFTSGRDVFFAAGQYRLHSRTGMHLLAHEVVHTLQNQAVNTAQILRRAPGEPVRDSCGEFGYPATTEWIADPTLDEIRSSTYSDEPVILSRGSDLQSVALLQAFLYHYVCEEDPTLLAEIGDLEADASGVYAKTTKSLVKTFQRHATPATGIGKLARDGKLGPKTLAAMDVVLGLTPMVGPEENTYNLAKDACTKPDAEGGAGAWLGPKDIVPLDGGQLQWKIYDFGVGEHSLSGDHLAFLRETKQITYSGTSEIKHRSVVEIIADRLKSPDDDLKLRIEGTASRTGETKKGLNERLSRRRAHCTMMFLRRELAGVGYALQPKDVIGDGARRAQDAAARDGVSYEAENDEFRSVVISFEQAKNPPPEPPTPEPPTPETCPDSVRHDGTSREVYITLDCSREAAGEFYMNVALWPDGGGDMIHRTFKFWHDALSDCSFRLNPKTSEPITIPLSTASLPVGLRTLDEVRGAAREHGDTPILTYFPNSWLHSFDSSLGGRENGHMLSPTRLEDILLPGIWNDSCGENKPALGQLKFKPVTPIKCGAPPTVSVAECSTCMDLDKQVRAKTVEIYMSCHDDYHQHLWIVAPDVGVNGIYRKFTIEYFNQDDPFYQCRPIPATEGMAQRIIYSGSGNGVSLHELGGESDISVQTPLLFQDWGSMHLRVNDGGLSGLAKVPFDGSVVDCEKLGVSPRVFNGKLRAVSPVLCGTPNPSMPPVGECEHEPVDCDPKMKRRGATRFRAHIVRVSGDVKRARGLIKRFAGKSVKNIGTNLDVLSGTAALVTICSASKQPDGEDERHHNDQISRRFVFFSDKAPEGMMPVCATATAYSKVVTTKKPRYLESRSKSMWSDFQRLQPNSATLAMGRGHKSDSLTFDVGPFGDTEPVTFDFFRSHIQARCDDSTAHGVLVPVGSTGCSCFPPSEIEEHKCDLGTKVAKYDTFRIRTSPASIPGILRGAKSEDGSCDKLFAMHVNIGTANDDEETNVYREFLLLGRSLTCNYTPRVTSRRFSTDDGVQLADDELPISASGFLARPVFLTPLSMTIGKAPFNSLLGRLIDGTMDKAAFEINANIGGWFGGQLPGKSCGTLPTAMGIMIPAGPLAVAKCGPVPAPPVDAVEAPTDECARRRTDAALYQIRNMHNASTFLNEIRPNGFVFHQWDRLVKEARKVGPGGIIKDFVVVGLNTEGEKIVGLATLKVRRLPPLDVEDPKMYVELVEDICWYGMDENPTQRNPENCFEPEFYKGVPFTIEKVIFGDESAAAGELDSPAGDADD